MFNAVKVAIARNSPYRQNRVVTAAVRHREVARDVEPASRQLVPSLEPFTLEERAFIRLRLLLIQRRPFTRANRVLDAQQRRFVIPFRPQRAPFGMQRGQFQNVPLVTLLLKQAACQIVFVPPCLDQNDSTTRHQARIERRAIPIPHQFTAALAVGLLTILERVINQRNVSTAPCNCRAHTSGNVSPAVVRVHPVGRLAIRCQRHAAEHLAKLRFGDDVANIPPEVIGKVAVVTRRDNLPLRIAPQTPRREPLASQLRFAVPRRHEYHKAVNVAAFNRFQLFRDQFVVRCPLVLRQRVFSEPE